MLDIAISMEITGLQIELEEFETLSSDLIEHVDTTRLVIFR